MEGLTGGARMNAAAAIEGEQRRLGVRGRIGGQAPLDLGIEQLGDARAMRNEAALAKLAAPHDQQATVCINIAQTQPASLSCPETEPVAEREDDTICGT